MKDFKIALRGAIDETGVRNLAQFAQKCGVPMSTVSNAASKDKMPNIDTLVRILMGCGRPKLRDGRYEGDWDKLHRSACDALETVFAVAQDAGPARHSGAAESTTATAGQPPLALYRRTRVTATWTETTEIFVYTEALAHRLESAIRWDSGLESGSRE